MNLLIFHRNWANAVCGCQFGQQRHKEDSSIWRWDSRRFGIEVFIGMEPWLSYVGKTDIDAWPINKGCAIEDWGGREFRQCSERMNVWLNYC